MDFDQFVSEYIAEDHDFEQLSVMVLEGCRVWYPLTAEAEKQKLHDIYSIMKDAVDNQERLKADAQFHMTVAETAQNGFCSRRCCCCWMV